jgi:hypothetical protein
MRINTALNGNQAATVLALHLESAMRDTTGGAVTKLRREIAELDRRLADSRNALQQIERALTTGAEDALAGRVARNSDFDAIAEVDLRRHECWDPKEADQAGRTVSPTPTPLARR